MAKFVYVFQVNISSIKETMPASMYAFTAVPLVVYTSTRCYDQDEIELVLSEYVLIMLLMTLMIKHKQITSEI